MRYLIKVTVEVQNQYVRTTAEETIEGETFDKLTTQEQQHMLWKSADGLRDSLLEQITAANS